MVVAKPSALQTLRIDVDAQVAAPGTHTRILHVPPSQDWPSGQGIGLVPLPSAAQTTRSRVTGSQLVAPGAQTFAMQLPPRQVCAGGQAVVALADPRASHVRWCVASTQEVCPGTHAWATQVLAALQ